MATIAVVCTTAPLFGQVPEETQVNERRFADLRINRNDEQVAGALSLTNFASLREDAIRTNAKFAYRYTEISPWATIRLTFFLTTKPLAITTKDAHTLVYVESAEVSYQDGAAKVHTKGSIVADEKAENAAKTIREANLQKLPFRLVIKVGTDSPSHIIECVDGDRYWLLYRPGGLEAALGNALEQVHEIFPKGN